ncbi:helix-turn-helix domain-containing protein [Paenibacillus polymyxa]|uniref:Helix-turn-helix domain-containing protein n=1 Tax=Paenibacillus polymyxa TaxID=1406 RepID=A0AAP4A004_PAEPO|nr:XRE family transcriptional regulator [Paenibacillus polymyxa]MDH2330495.1 helix-turn-helix domain-containing protein [Paenibacillus polymyxa]
MEIFSARLRWLRLQKQLTQKEMADLLDISQQYYGRFEQNKGEPNLESLVKISEIFNETVDFLLGIEDLTKEAKELLKKSLELAESIKDINDRLEKVYITRMFLNNGKDEFDSDFQDAILENYKKNLPQKKAKYRELAIEFALLVVKIPFSKFYGEGVVDNEGNILYDPEKIVDEYQDLD